MERRTFAIWKRRSAESLAAIVTLFVGWVVVVVVFVMLEEKRRNDPKS